MYRYLKQFCIFFTALFVYGCANIVEPSGGPDDKTAPEIINFSPKNTTINFKSDNTIKIKFSEYVNKSSVIDNIRISPKVPLDYSWSGKELEISFLDTLISETTYCLTLDSKYTDNNGVIPRKAFSMIFSTGNSIDSGKISGKVYNKTTNGLSVFAFRMSASTADTFDLRNHKADYYISLGSSGEFNLNALKDGLYRIVLVEDKNDNQYFNEGTELYASSKSDINIKQDSIAPKIIFYLTNMTDTLKPQLIDAEALSNNRIKLEFTEPIDTFSISSKGFILTDSITNSKIKITSADNPDKKRELVYIQTMPILDKNKTYKIEVIDSNNTALKDTAGNPVDIKKNSLFFKGNSDTLNSILIYKYNIKDSTKNIDLEQLFDFEFNTPVVNPENVKFELRNTVDNKNVEFGRKEINSRIIRINPLNKLKSSNWYKLQIHIDSVFDYYNAYVKDTVFNVNFMTADHREFGSISGKVEFDSPIIGKCIVILSNERDKAFYNVPIDSITHFWSINELAPGDYKVDIYIDENGNGHYDSGEAFPYVKSEDYYEINKIAKIIARWKVEDFDIIINN